MDERGLLDAVFRGDREATERLVTLLGPVVLARAARMAMRRGRRRDDPIVEDLGQDVFSVLFANDARVLRAWEPSRGLSLVNFVGLIAEREASSILRSGRRSAWNESPTELEQLEGLVGAAPEEHKVDARDILVEIVERLREQLSPRGLELFQALIVDERSTEDVGQAHGLSAAAVYQWKSRLLALARKIGEEIVSERTSGQRIPKGTNE